MLGVLHSKPRSLGLYYAKSGEKRKGKDKMCRSPGPGGWLFFIRSLERKGEKGSGTTGM